jgi:hypothetical protein
MNLQTRKKSGKFKPPDDRMECLKNSINSKLKKISFNIASKFTSNTYILDGSDFINICKNKSETSNHEHKIITTKSNDLPPNKPSFLKQFFEEINKVDLVDPDDAVDLVDPDDAVDLVDPDDAVDLVDPDDAVDLVDPDDAVDLVDPDDAVNEVDEDANKNKNIEVCQRRFKQLLQMRTAKISLNQILKDDDEGNKKRIIFDAVCRTNQIVIHTYMFIRLLILNKYHNNQDIPIITTDFIAMAIKALTKTSIHGPKPKGSNLKLFNEFKIFYESEYKNLGYIDKINGANLSKVLQYMEKDIVKNIENNIKLHFVSYVKRFVNSSFKKENATLISGTKKGEITKMRKELKKDLYEIKQDLLTNTLKCNSKYHNWIRKNKNHIFPVGYNGSFDIDIKINPQKYIKHMIYMCIELEKLGSKSFQFFPLRTEMSPKYIPIDTASLIELFIVGEKNKYLNDIEHCKKELWDNLMKTDNPIFSQKYYTFDYRISTDGFAVSIQLLRKDLVEDAKVKKNKKKVGRQSVRELYKGLKPNAIEKIKNHKIAEEQKRKEKIIAERKKERDEKKEKFKKLSKEEQKEQRENEKKEKQERKEMKKKTDIVFPYMEEMNESEYERLQVGGDWGVDDPGKNNLVCMKGNNGEHLRYSNKQHLKKTKRLKYQRLINNHKKKKLIDVIERELASFNSKSCDYEKFKEYINKKNEINGRLMEEYKDEIFRKYKWYGHINRKKAETDLIREIGKKFGKDVTIMYGDWSVGKQMRGKISTPNISLKRKIGEYYRVYDLDEFRTSCLNHKTLERCDNMYLPDKKGVMRKKHSILTYQMENNRRGCINRDKNSVNNMIRIVKQFLKDKTRPIHFRRGVELEDIIEPIKDNNHNTFMSTIKLY